MARDIWKHGKYVDTWSVVHFLSGFLLTAACYWAGLDLRDSLTLSLALLLLWEAFEALMRIIEPSPNLIADIVIGLLGSFLAALMYFYLALTLVPLVFYILLAVVVGMSLWGFLDYLIRGYR